MNQTLNLYRLQQIDSQIDRLQSRLMEIRKILDDDAEINQIKEHVEAANARCESAGLALQKAEKEVQNQFIKIEQTQSSLYGDKYHSPKELQELQNEVIALKRYLTVLEDRQINAMQESETAEADRQVVLTSFDTTLVIRAEQKNNLCQEQKVIENDLERFLVERNAVAGAIPVADLGFYNQLRQQRRGVAVAVIADNSCGACGSTLSLAQIQSARSAEQTMLCPSCGRILYAS
jgi:predicted  nucleic acid-binding Zn-ribbon protein